MARVAALLLFVSAALAGAPSGGAAGTGAAEEAGAVLCEGAIVTGARRGGVPVDVLRAIALTETGRSLGGRMRPWPWAINREGQGHWFASRDEALAFARASVAAGRRSFDVGCFQINYHWHGHAFPSLEAMFDQDMGGTYAAQFLRSLREEFGAWSPAAGAYHSRTPVFAERYRARFDRMLAGLGGTALEVAALDPPEADDEAAAPRRSRTRMASRPKIVTLSKRPVADDPVAARVATIRVERGRVPASVAAALGGTAEAAAPPGAPLTLSTRGAPL